MEDNYARAPALRSSPALAGCLTHPAPQVRSLLCVIIITGMNRILRWRIAREFIDSDFVRFAGGYSSFCSIEPLSLIPLVQPSSRTCTIDATEIANSIIEEIGKRATIRHQISGGVERAAVRSGKNHKKTTIVRDHRKTPGFWQTDHNDRYLGAYRWNERNTKS